MKLDQIIRNTSVVVVIVLAGIMKYNSVHVSEPKPKGALRVECVDTIYSPAINQLLIDDKTSSITAYIN